MNGHKYNLVMIDDQVDFLEATKESLSDHFNIIPFTKSQDALKFIDHHQVDAILLDYHLRPGDSAWEAYNELQKKEFQNPIMVLSGESSATVKLEGLELGVDDFLQKPISTTELSAYIRNRIRNARKRNPQVVKVKNLSMNLQDPQIHVDEKPVILTNKEFEILRLLVSNKNAVVTKNKILEKIWANVAVEKNNIDTHMSNLRKKLSGFECQIKTIKKIGYVLRA